MNDNKEFLDKLKALLWEYNMSINFACSDGSDTHGINDGRIEIEDSKGKVIFRTWHEWQIDPTSF